MRRGGFLLARIKQIDFRLKVTKYKRKCDCRHFLIVLPLFGNIVSRVTFEQSIRHFFGPVAPIP